MKFPIIVGTITEEEAQRFNQHFADANGEFEFEGVWFRNQRPENASQSGWKNENDANRRYFQFFDTYKAINKEGKYYLAVIKSYIYISSTYKLNETDKYYQKVVSQLSKYGFTKISNDMYNQNDLFIKLLRYNEHPKNKEFGLSFPDGYTSLDIIITSPNLDYSDIYNRMWKLSTKMYRMPGKRQSPTYINSVKDILPYLPAQIELGCGPSIELGIPPLYDMHETYRVQNHISKKFYFGDDDDFVTAFIKNPESMYKAFAKVPNICLKASTNDSYDTFAKMFKHGYFVGTVLNNNFDRIVKRYGIEEKILRIYDKNIYLPQIDFSPNAKSLICIGTHADRRQVQKQAREKGLPIIFIDPEGFVEKDGFVSYPIEAPQSDDLILKTTFKEAMTMFKSELNL